MAHNLTLQTSARYVSGEFDYELVSGDTVYYSNHPDVSASSNLGSLTAGDFLARGVPSWIVSAGTSYIKQQQRAGVDSASIINPPDTGVSSYDGDTRSWGIETIATDADLAAHEADTTAVHGIADTSVLATDSDLALKADIA